MASAPVKRQMWENESQLGCGATLNQLEWKYQNPPPSKTYDLTELVASVASPRVVVGDQASTCKRFKSPSVSLKLEAAADTWLAVTNENHRLLTQCLSTLSSIVFVLI